jgi:CDP-diacylglycerol---serine O-phosphatidyltransferase
MLRPRRPKLKGFSVNRLIPNILTVLALCAGMTVIRFALLGQWRLAVVALVVAAFLDGLDGRLARLLGGTSKFGAEFDSLSDFLSFGAAPAILVYQWSLQQYGGFGWTVALLFSVCCALRLARFNTMIGNENLPAYWANYFTGVPAPAGAGLAVLPMILSFEIGPAFMARPALNAVVLVAVAGLMVSRVPTFSGKIIRIPHHMVLPTLLCTGIVFTALIGAPWITLSIMGFLYIAALPVGVYVHTKARRSVERQTALPSSVEPPRNPTE